MWYVLSWWALWTSMIRAEYLSVWSVQCSALYGLIVGAPVSARALGYGSGSPALASFLSMQGDPSPCSKALLIPAAKTWSRTPPTNGRFSIHQLTLLGSHASWYGIHVLMVGPPSLSVHKPNRIYATHYPSGIPPQCVQSQSTKGVVVKPVTYS